MNETFKILNGEQKTFSWGVVFKGDVTNSTRGEIKSVSIKSDFPNFANLKAGDEISGVYYKSDKGYVTIYPPKAENTPNGQNSRSGGSMGANLINLKDKATEKAQVRKNDAIILTTSMQLAVQLAIADGKPTPANVEMWRLWLLEKWDNEPKSPISIDEPPQV